MDSGLIPVDIHVSPEQLITDQIQGLIDIPGSLQVLEFGTGQLNLVAVRAVKGGHPERTYPRVRLMPPVIVQSLFTDMHDEKDQSIRCTHTNTMWNKHSQSSHKTTKWVDSQKMPRRLGPSLNQSTRRLHTKPMLLRCREWSGTAKITAHTNPASPQNAFASKRIRLKTGNELLGYSGKATA